MTSCGDRDQRIGSEKFKLRPFHFRLENWIAIGDEFWSEIHLDLKFRFDLDFGVKFYHVFGSIGLSSVLVFFQKRFS